MKDAFSELKATQIACYLLRLSGGKVNYTWLIKVMYMIERESILKWGTPIIFDRLYSLKNGPVVSETLDLAKGDIQGKIWDSYIRRERFSVFLKTELEADDISVAELELISKLYEKYKDFSYSDMINEVHRLPECVETNSRVQISYKDIFFKNGIPEEKAAIYLRNLSFLHFSNANK